MSFFVNEVFDDLPHQQFSPFLYQNLPRLFTLIWWRFHLNRNFISGEKPCYIYQVVEKSPWNDKIRCFTLYHKLLNLLFDCYMYNTGVSNTTASLGQYFCFHFYAHYMAYKLIIFHSKLLPSNFFDDLFLGSFIFPRYTCQ